MNPRVQQAINGIKFWLVQRKFRDLWEYHELGDDGRFERLVGAGGKRFDGLSPAGHVASIRRLTKELVGAGYDVQLDGIEQQLREWGYSHE